MPLTSKEVQQQAQAEGLTLLAVAENITGYFGVGRTPSLTMPFNAQVWRYPYPYP